MAGGSDRGGGFAESRLGWFVVALVWLLFGALILWGRGGLFDYLKAREQVRALEAQVKALEEENAALEADIRRLKEHPEVYEAVARERLFMKKPGEIILYLPPEDSKPPHPAPPGAPVSAPPVP